MKTQETVFRHFKNEYKTGDNHGFAMIQDLIDKVPFIKGSISLMALPTITVCGVITEGMNSKILKIGVSRSSNHDTFSKQKGRVYAEWRAKNAPVISMKLPLESDDTFTYNMFQIVAEECNAKFVPIESARLLAKLPESVLIHDIRPIVEKTKWTEQMIQDAKNAKELKVMTQVHEDMTHDSAMLAAH